MKKGINFVAGWWSHIDLYEYYFEGQEYDTVEYDVCKHFGCGKKLIPQEKLFSDRCFEHNRESKLTHGINCYISGMIMPIDSSQQRCAKSCHYTKAQAKKFMKEFNKGKRGERKLTNIYFCESCQAYHTTSMPQKKSRALTRKNNINKNKSK